MKATAHLDRTECTRSDRRHLAATGYPGSQGSYSVISRNLNGGSVAVTPRRMALMLVPLALALLAGCSSTSAGTGVGSAIAGSASNAASASLPSDSANPSGAAGASGQPAQVTTAQQAPVTVVKTSTHTPQPVSSTNMANAGQFGGDWKGANGATLEVSSDESANVDYPVGVTCASGTSSPTPCDKDTSTPGGFTQLHIKMIVTTGDTAVATAEVRNTNDPKFTDGQLVKLTLKGGVISSPFGAYAKV
jgi:hypothetical protein